MAQNFENASVGSYDLRFTRVGQNFICCGHRLLASLAALKAAEGCRTPRPGGGSKHPSWSRSALVAAGLWPAVEPWRPARRIKRWKDGCVLHISCAWEKSAVFSGGQDARPLRQAGRPPLHGLCSPCLKSGVALRLPPQSKTSWTGIAQIKHLDITAATVFYMRLPLWKKPIH